MNPEERHQLIDDLIEGGISEANFLRLEAELSIDSDTRKEYYDRLALSALLENEAAEETGENIIVLPQEHGNNINWMALAAIAVGLLAIVVLLVRQPEPVEVTEKIPDEKQASGFAVVVGQANAMWKDPSSLTDGTLVPGGPIELESGVAQLELFSGVTVIVEGAAEFEIVSPMEMAVASGKVRVRVPDAAHGFRIHTAGGDVVDLGTEFALNVSPAQSELHVLEGEVEWHPVAEDMRPLKEGEGLSWSENGVGFDLRADRSRFVGGAEMHDQLAMARKSREEIWKQQSDRLKDDPRLVAYYQTGATESWERRLVNDSTVGSDTVGEGAIVAAVRSVDRWGNAHGALDFSPTGSRVRLNVPGEYGSITLLCWVKINSLDRWYNSLFLTDGHELHEPHWQIMDDGRLFFSVKKNDTWDSKKGERDKHIFYSPSFWNTSLSGQWLMIATTYDVDEKRVTHYLNGKVLSRESVPEAYLVETVKIGNASLGNWGVPEREEPRFAIRNLNGSMSEFALFKASLSEDVIMRIYSNGRP